MERVSYIGEKSPCLTLERYEAQEVNLHYNELGPNTLHNDQGNFVPLSTFKEDFMYQILSQVKKLIPDDQLTTTMNILDQRNIS